MCKFSVLLLIAMFLQILPKVTKKNRNKTGNITQTKITGIFTTLNIMLYDINCHFVLIFLTLC
jgi:hypothetical protein